MSILSINVNTTGLVGDTVNPRRNTMVTTDNLATITAAGYLNGQNASGNPILPTDIFEVLYSFNATTQSGTFGIFTVTYVAATGFQLVIWDNPGNVLLPVVSGNIPKFNGTSGQIEDANIAASSLVLNTSVSGQSIAASTTSATPGTIRALKGLMISTAATMTSGNIVGLRGEVDYISASGGFIYGAQGKIIPTGTLSGSSWNAGLFGQVDISAATINAGQIAPIWGDYGTSSHTLTSTTGMYGIAMTNTTAAVLAGQLYLYGGATNLLLLDTNTGGVGATYVTSGGSGGLSGTIKKLAISIDGTTYYIPCATVVS